MSIRLKTLWFGLGAVFLFGSLMDGAASAQAMSAAAPLLVGITRQTDAAGHPALLLSFNAPPPVFSVIGDGSDQPVIAFAGARAARGLAAPSDLANAVVIEPADSVLSVHLKEAGPTHLLAAPIGEHGVLVTIFNGADDAGPGPANRPSVRLDPNEDGFEVVPLKYADVSEIVGLLTGEQGIRPNDNFTPQEPAFGSAAMNNNNSPPPSPVILGASFQGGDAAPLMLGQSIDTTIGIDRRLNAVVLRGSSDLIAKLRAKIAKLDRPISSVLLETTFVELTESGAKNVGLNLSNTNGQIAAGAYNVGATVSGLSEPKSYATASLQAAIYAQVQKGNGRIISKPRISAQSGASAKIITGDAVPILTSITLSGVNGVSQQVQYVTVGVTLQIAPRVSDDGFVTSHVFCEVSSVTGYSQGYPTISQREATTSATVKDGQSFVIGGLTQEASQNTGSEVPGLGAIPGLGQFFKLHQSTRSKTDLYIVITPHIVPSGSGTEDQIAKSRSTSAPG